MKANTPKQTQFDEFEKIVLEELESNKGFTSGLKQQKKKSVPDQSCLQSMDSEEIETKLQCKTPTRAKVTPVQTGVHELKQPLAEKSANRATSKAKVATFESSDLSGLKNLEKEAKKVSFSQPGILRSPQRETEISDKAKLYSKIKESH